MPKHTFLRIFAAFPALLGLTLAVPGCGSKGQAQAPAGGFAVPVTAVTAISRDVPVYLDEIGKCTASQSVTIVPQVSGIVKKRLFEDGAAPRPRAPC